MRAGVATSVAAIALALAGCGGADEEEAQTSASLPATTGASTPPDVEGVPPTTSRLLGTWSRTGQRLLVRFSPDGRFALDTSNPDTPYAAGTYEVDGTTMTFTSEGPYCVDTWAWKAGMVEAEDRSEDELRIVFTKAGCDVIVGTEWTFARFG